MCIVSEMIRCDEWTTELVTDVCHNQAVEGYSQRSGSFSSTAVKQVAGLAISFTALYLCCCLFGCALPCLSKHCLYLYPKFQRLHHSIQLELSSTDIASVTINILVLY
jgi:hypothetical protein